MECRRRIERDTVIEAKSQADEPSGPAGLNPPRKQAEDMTAPETFAKLQRTLDKGRRPDMTVHSIFGNDDARRPSPWRNVRADASGVNLVHCHVWTAPRVIQFTALRLSGCGILLTSSDLGDGRWGRFGKHLRGCPTGGRAKAAGMSWLRLSAWLWRRCCPGRMIYWRSIGLAVD